MVSLSHNIHWYPHLPPDGRQNPGFVRPAVFHLWYMIRTQPYIINTRCGPEMCFYNLIGNRCPLTDANTHQENKTQLSGKKTVIGATHRERKRIFDWTLAYLDLWFSACLFCLVCGNLVIRYACYSKWEIRLLKIEFLPSFMPVKIRALNPGRHFFLWARKWHAIRSDISSAPSRGVIKHMLASSCLMHWYWRRHSAS